MEHIIQNKGFEKVGIPEEGGFATVYKVQNTDGIVRAFKTPKIPQNASIEVKKKIKEDFRNECKNLLNLNNGHNSNRKCP